MPYCGILCLLNIQYYELTKNNRYGIGTHRLYHRED